MKKFKSYKSLRSKFILIIVFVFIFDILIFSVFGKDFSNNIMYIVRIKIEELTNYYLNDTIKKYLNINTSDYIKLNLVNNSIVSVDIDNKSSNLLLNSVINDLENNVHKIVDNYYNLEIIEGSDAVIVYVPVGVIFDNALLSNLGPKIPIKVNFLESIDAYVDVDVLNYGINNSLVKLYININLKVNIEMPIDKEVINISYKYLLASKLINGKVPSIYGSSIGDNSGIVNSSVN